MEKFEITEKATKLFISFMNILLDDKKCSKYQVVVLEDDNSVWTQQISEVVNNPESRYCGTPCTLEYSILENNKEKKCCESKDFPEFIKEVRMFLENNDGIIITIVYEIKRQVHGVQIKIEKKEIFIVLKNL